MKRTIIIVLLIAVVSNVFAQQNKKSKADSKPKADTLAPRTVTITAAFKPALKTTSKVNFSAATPLPDTSRQVLQYDVPAQNITFSYQSPALKPLAENIDTVVHWENRSFIKAGYGN